MLGEHSQLGVATRKGHVELDGENAEKVGMANGTEALDFNFDLLDFLTALKRDVINIGKKIWIFFEIVVY